MQLRQLLRHPRSWRGEGHLARFTHHNFLVPLPEVSRTWACILLLTVLDDGGNLLYICKHTVYFIFAVETGDGWGIVKGVVL